MKLKVTGSDAARISQRNIVSLSVLCAQLFCLEPSAKPRTMGTLNQMKTDCFQLYTACTQRTFGQCCSV
jgi:hypothetical protein